MKVDAERRRQLENEQSVGAVAAAEHCGEQAAGVHAQPASRGRCWQDNRELAGRGEHHAGLEKGAEHRRRRNKQDTAT